VIELRSDTFTKPTKEMLETITNADLGDDVYNEDPSVNELERYTADIFGKEDSCLVPSGTMANLSSILSHCQRGSKILVGDESDIFIYEAGGASVCGGIVYESIPTQKDGRLLISDFKKAIPDDKSDPQFALPELVCLENTHNRCGGRLLPLEYISEVYDFTRENNMKLHIDGARIFNAIVALGISPKEIGKLTDSLQFCLSKGLSAPIGSIVVGNSKFISKVKKIRKMLGGGMRQAGIIAAPGLYSLKNMVERLEEDHKNALYLTEKLQEIHGVSIENKVETNIVFFKLNIDNKKFIREMLNHNIRIEELGHGRLRAVTHSGVSREDIQDFIKITKKILKKQ
jgi:threonine aldolase